MKKSHNIPLISVNLKVIECCRCETLQLTKCFTQYSSWILIRECTLTTWPQPSIHLHCRIVDNRVQLPSLLYHVQYCRIVDNRVQLPSLLYHVQYPLQVILPAADILDFALPVVDIITPGGSSNIHHTITLNATSSLTYALNYTTDYDWFKITNVTVLSVGGNLPGLVMASLTLDMGWVKFINHVEGNSFIYVSVYYYIPWYNSTRQNL